MTVVTQTFNVKALMKQVIESTKATKSSDIAEEVLEAIPEDHYRDALRQILPTVVTQVLSNLRTQYPTATVKATVATNGHTPGKKASPSANSANSAKNASIKKWVKKLSMNISLNPEGTERKLLGDCSFDDLMAAAQLRYDQAASMASRGDEYKAFAELVKEYEVDHFRDLPQDVLEKVLSDD